MDYIAYYRVSTQQQGRSGLGIEAQQQTVRKFLKEGDQLIEQYTEVESGKRNNRPQLEKAISQVQSTGSTLLIAKLDRLSRNAGFIFMLRDTGIPFIAADMPDANHLTVGLMAVLADHERQLISERTRAALQALKARGKELGSPDNFTDIVRERGRKTMQQKAYHHANNRRAGLLSISLYQQGNSYASIARQLNEYGFKTRRGKDFSHVQVKRLIERYR